MVIWVARPSVLGLDLVILLSIKLQAAESVQDVSRVVSSVDLTQSKSLTCA